MSLDCGSDPSAPPPVTPPPRALEPNPGVGTVHGWQVTPEKARRHGQQAQSAAIFAW